MDVYMGYINAHHSLANLDAGAYFLQTLGHTLGKKMQLAEQLVVQIKDVIHLFLGYAQHVATYDGVDIEEGQTMFGLGHKVGDVVEVNVPAGKMTFELTKIER